MRSWPALLLIPLLVLSNLTFTYSQVSPACATQNDSWPVHAANLATLIISLFLTWLAWREWQDNKAARGECSKNTYQPNVRRRFVAMVATLMGALFLLVVVAQWIAAGVLSPCLQ